MECSRQGGPTSVLGSSRPQHTASLPPYRDAGATPPCTLTHPSLGGGYGADHVQSNPSPPGCGLSGHA